MSISLVALIIALMASGVTNLLSTYLTVAASALACILFFAACMLRTDCRLHLMLLVAPVLMCILCMCSSEYHMSPVHSTIDILLCYSALIGLAAVSDDLSVFCRRVMLFSFLIPVGIVLGQTAKNGVIQSWKIGGLGMSPNYIAAHINMTIPLIIAYAGRARAIVSMLLWGLVFSGCFAVFCIGSRNGIGTMLIMLVLFGLFNHKRTAIITCLVMAVGLMLLDDIMQNEWVYQLLTRVRLINFEAKTTRTLIWSISGQYIQDSPWLGVGPGGSEKALAVIDINHAHNNVVQIALESGLPAAALFVWISFRQMWIPAAALLHTRESFLASLSVIAYFMVSLTDNTIHHPETTVLLIACLHEARRALLVPRDDAAAALSARPPGMFPGYLQPRPVPAWSTSSKFPHSGERF